jgi:glycosyltransferase involved in cell wall biosynthesis
VAGQLIGGRYDASTPEPVAAGGPREVPLVGTRAAIEPFLVHQLGVPVLLRGALRRELSGNGRGPDVIHYHNLSLLGGVGALTLGDATKFFTPHEYWLVCPTHQLMRFGREPCTRPTCLRCVLRAGQPPQWWRYTPLRDRCLGHVDRMLFPSELTRATLHDRGVRRPSAVMHHFLPDKYLHEADAAGRRRGDVEPYFLYVGRIDVEKGIGPLVGLFGSGAAPAPLRVAGTGPLRETLEASASSDRVRFLGRVEGAELAALYRDAIAVILPSVGFEVFGLVVPEAMAHGTPAVVSNRAGAAEVVEASGGGIVYETEGELSAVLHVLAGDPTRRDELGAAGRDYVREQLGESRYVDRYETLVREARST